MHFITKSTNSFDSQSNRCDSTNMDCFAANPFVDEISIWWKQFQLCFAFNRDKQRLCLCVGGMGDDLIDTTNWDWGLLPFPLPFTKVVLIDRWFS